MKNVARTYSLEHEGESLLFDQLFELLSNDMQHEESYWRELASRTGALQTSIDQHMFKEEEQVYISFFCGSDCTEFIHYALKLQSLSDTRQIMQSAHSIIDQHFFQVQCWITYLITSVMLLLVV